MAPTARTLDTLRNISLKFKEADKIMEAAGLDPAGTGIPADAGVRNSGLLKFLRHLYMVGLRGSQQVWVRAQGALTNVQSSGYVDQLRIT